MTEPKRYLDIAARAAIRAFGDVEPNPLVGCVLVKEDRIIGIGHHKRFGHLHAEREALADARAKGNDPRGSAAYVTLEPCRHFGKQPPCTDALIEAGIAEVVAARPDPADVSGGGFRILREAGIICRFDPSSSLATAISEPFCKRVATGLPWVIAKWAQTIDGRIATRSGESKWISGEHSRARVHKLRARVDAMLTSMGTVIADDPMLTPRGVRRIHRVATRVVVDTGLDIDENTQLVRTAAVVPTIVCCSKELSTAHLMADKVERLEAAGVEVMGVPHEVLSGGLNKGLDLELLLRALVDHKQISTVVVEAGGGMLGSLLEADLIDEAVVYLAPLVLGDEQAFSAASGRIAAHLAEGRRFRLLRTKRLGDDLELHYRRTRD
ncbi:MAG: bifunctional diaminohydroxyphosphoribosylaminopyrimidine deaminase/5-amino-6-(5-phosphoribosylamino)uracil reductase RibD [Phycisphaeraceae bacterium]|nr:bifunctional diaminohydroxyphosphoribosylaminopyrimidine deaminase/5-amino-6-(5-phosphoribosylamino)uracil reductase RibD [Phycisphaeraceae bacterium]